MVINNNIHLHFFFIDGGWLAGWLVGWYMSTQFFFCTHNKSLKYEYYLEDFFPQSICTILYRSRNFYFIL